MLKSKVFLQVVMAQFYNTSTFSEVNRVLAYYDLSDLVAALVPLPLSIIGPADALMHPQSATAFEKAYVCMYCLSTSGVGFRCKLKHPLPVQILLPPVSVQDPWSHTQVPCG